MKGKVSFLLYADLKTTVDQLPDDVAGRLFKMILDYVNDLDPQTDELVLKVAFEPIKQQMKRDLKEWEKVRGKRSLAGQISAAQRQLLSTNVEECSTHLTGNVNVNDNVDVIDWNKFIEVYNLIFNKKSKVVPDAVRKKYKARLKEGYTKQDIIAAMKNAKKDEFHKTTNPPFKHLTLEFFSRPDKLDRFTNQGIEPTKYIPTL
jgi:hypothetical protein